MSATPLTIKQKKEWAKLLFIKENITIQKELALRTGVSEKTIGKWIKEEDWERFKVSSMASKSEQLNNLYRQLSELNSTINDRPEGQRFAKPAESDTIIKLTAGIRNLETETGAMEAMEVGQAFLQFVRVTSFPDLLHVTDLYDAYLKKLINESR